MAAIYSLLNCPGTYLLTLVCRKRICGQLQLATYPYNTSYYRGNAISGNSAVSTNSETNALKPFRLGETIANVTDASISCWQQKLENCQ